MSTAAIVMMLVAMLVIWGGLALAILNLNRSTDVPSKDEVHRDL
jgi:hypothetical protein